MSKKSGRRRRDKDLSARHDDELPTPAWRAKRGVYLLLYVGLLIVPLGFSGVPGMYNASYYITILLAAGLAAGLLWALHKKAITLVYTPFFVVLGAWLAVKLLTSASSILPYHSVWGTYREWSDGFMYALAAAVIGVAVITLRPDGRRIIRIIGLLTAEAVVFAAITIGQAVAAGFFYQKVRPDSPLGNADFFISYSLLFVPVLLVLAVKHFRTRRWWRLSVSGIASLIMLMAVFVSLPTHLQTILLPAFENGKVDTTYGATDAKPISSANFTADRANSERWSEWKFGLQFGLSRPITGTGPSTTSQAFDSAVANHSISLPREWDDSAPMNRSHNDLIEQFSQEGVLGLAAYLAIWVVLIVIVVWRRRQIEPEMRPYAIGLGAGLVLWFVFNQLVFTTVVAGVVVMVWAALLLTMVKSARPVQGRVPVIGLVTGSLVLGLAGIWACKYWVNDTTADLAIVNSNQLLSQLSSGDSRGTWQHVASQAAAAANDMPFEPYYSEMAAVSYLYAYGQVKNASPVEHQAQAAKALQYARQMLADSPNNPEYIELAGNAQYVVSPIGSKAAKSGLAQTDKAIALAPNSVAMYVNIAGNALAKKDYLTARKYVAMGFAAPLSSLDRQKLSKFAAKIPAQ